MTLLMQGLKCKANLMMQCKNSLKIRHLVQKIVRNVNAFALLNWFPAGPVVKIHTCSGASCYLCYLTIGEVFSSRSRLSLAVI